MPVQIFLWRFIACLIKFFNSLNIQYMMKTREVTSRIITAVALAISTVCLPACRQQQTGKDFDLQSYIDKELATGKKEIVIPPGTYRVTPQNHQHLYFADLQDVTIIATDVEMVCTETTRAITFERCKNMTLKGLTIDYDPLCFTQGVITKLSDNKSVIEFKLDDNYPDNLIERIEIFDQNSLTLKRETYYKWGEFKKVANRIYQVDKGVSYKYDPKIDLEEVGDILVTNNEYAPNGSIPHAVYSDKCVNLQLENITLYSGNAFGYFETNGTKNTYLRCKIDRRPQETDLRERKQRVRSNDADAFHSKYAYIGPQLIECFTQFQGDDGLNICGEYYMAVGGKENTIRIVSSHKINLEVGDEIEIMTVDGKRLPEAKIEKIEDDETISPSEIQKILSLNVHAGLQKLITRENNKIIKLTIDKPVGIVLGTVISSRNRTGNGFLVKDCYFGYNRSRGVLIKASDGKILYNTLDHNNMHAVLISPEAWWLESGSSDNVMVESNRIISNGHAQAISVTGVGLVGGIPPAGLHNNIVIKSNELTDCYNPCIYVASTKDGAVMGNTIIGEKQMPGQKKEDTVSLVNCENVATDF